jgi:polysaccharide deacetylase 2 family uncharacterized protein YibQ
MFALLLLLSLSPVFAQAPGKPKIAVVIDDFGLTYKKNVPDEDWMKIQWPITFAVMPESPVTTQAAKRTKESGHELIIHYPFDPFQSLDMAKDRATEHDVESMKKLLDKAFKQIPGPVGLNNHRSYKGTMNRPLMEAFMKLYKPRGLYFLDSHVSQKSVAYDEAKKAGIPAARNFIFLEEPHHYNDKKFAAAMIRVAAQHARKTGQVVLIGHHYFHGTYDALMEEIPKLQAEGFELVFCSALAR